MSYSHNRWLTCFYNLCSINNFYLLFAISIFGKFVINNIFFSNKIYKTFFACIYGIYRTFNNLARGIISTHSIKKYFHNLSLLFVLYFIYISIF